MLGGKTVIFNNAKGCDSSMNYYDGGSAVFYDGKCMNYNERFTLTDVDVDTSTITINNDNNKSYSGVQRSDETCVIDLTSFSMINSTVAAENPNRNSNNQQHGAVATSQLTQQQRRTLVAKEQVLSSACFLWDYLIRL